MEFTGEKVINAPRRRVYDALHDPVVLRQAIPGCQGIDALDPGHYRATIALKIGPIRADFSGTIEVYNQEAPSGYSLHAEADGGLGGSASGDAHVALAVIDERTTNLAYYIHTEFAGQLAALESRQIETAARTLATEFFSRLDSALGTGPIVLTTASTPGPRPSGGWSAGGRSAVLEDVADQTAYIAAYASRAAERRGQPRATEPSEQPVQARATEAAEWPAEHRAAEASEWPAQRRTAEPNERPAPARAAEAPVRFDAGAVETSPPTTDALGAPLDPSLFAGAAGVELYPAAGTEPVGARDAGERRIGARTVPPSDFGETRPASPINTPKGGVNLWRWFLVLLGVAAIFVLLTGNF